MMERTIEILENYELIGDRLMDRQMEFIASPNLQLLTETPYVMKTPFSNVYAGYGTPVHVHGME